MAWLGAFSLLAGLAGVFAISAFSKSGPGRVALPIEGLELFARAPEPSPHTPEEERLSNPSHGVRLAAPNLRDGNPAGGPATDAIEGVETNDILLYPEEFDIAGVEDEFAADEIVITIDGQPQGATPISNASLALAPTRIAIPDPDPALLRSTPLGQIPKIAPDGRKALSAYARPFNNPEGSPRIAIVVGGLGLNPALTERAIDELPPEVSLAFAPYAKDLEFWTRKARRAGHEVLIELPMEGYGGDQRALGAAGLLSSRSAEENLQRLDWLLSRFGGYFAATNYMGAKFSTDASALAPVLNKLNEAGIAYIDDTGAARASGAGTAAAFTTVNRMIPPSPDDSGRRAVRRELQALEKIAERDGAALGKTYAYAATLDEIIGWAAQAEEKGFVAAPASSVLQARAATR